tara:strand:- start:5148 stop:6821 length:1674 start_codon:yes stop_codon:yes gene_type:complete
MTEKKNIFICLSFLSIFWVYIWGVCANPFQVSCFSYAGTGDHIQHYLGWISYAKDANTDLLSRTFSGWTWPINSKILYFDSIPLLSIIFKPFVSLIGVDFQYFSIASLANLIATYYCGLLIGKYFKLKSGLSSLLGILLALSPIALIRLIGHESLSLHFLIVFPITLLLIRSVDKWKWSLLIFSSLGTHAYFFPMVFLLKVSSSIYQFRNSSLRMNKLFLLFLKDLFITSFSIILGLYSFGYIGNSFYLNKNSFLWSANLLSLFDPGDFSLIFNKLEIVRPYQWEGYSYLGLLFFVLLTISFILKLYNKSDYNPVFPERSFFVVILIFFFFIALGSPIYFGKSLLINKSILMYEGSFMKSFMNTFRSTGRFIWPIYYSLIIWSYLNVAQRVNSNRKLSNIFITLALFFMMENYFLVFGTVRNEINSHYVSGVNFEKEIKNSIIAKLIKENKYFINATGRPSYISPNIPILMPQAVNNNIITNYHPRLARDNIEFINFYSQESCQILSNIFDLAEDDLISQSLVLMDSESINECNQYDFEEELKLPNENISIFSLTRK